MSQIFEKPTLSVDQQIDLLMSRGLTVSDKNIARYFLLFISYYRLSGYFQTFDLSPVQLESWLHCLTYVRNLCAHHARLWNRHFTITLMRKEKFSKWFIPNNTFAAQAAMIKIMLNIISPGMAWAKLLFNLLHDHPELNPIHLGFDKCWMQDTFWNCS